LYTHNIAGKITSHQNNIVIVLGSGGSGNTTGLILLGDIVHKLLSDVVYIRTNVTHFKSGDFYYGK
jgi:predicted ATP-binding protein involved in virulence